MDVRRGHIGCSGAAGHTCRDGDEASDAVRQGATDLVEHRADGQSDGLVTLTVLQLAVFDGVGQGEDGGHLDERGRHVEEHQCDEHHDDVGGEKTQQNVSDNHGDHAADVQVAAWDVLVQNRVQRSHDEAGHQCDDAGRREGSLVVEHELEQEEEHASGGHVGDGVQQVGQGDPQQLVVLEQCLECLERVAVLLGLGTQGAGAFLSAEGNGPGSDDAEQHNDDAECGPAALALSLLTGEHVAEVGDNPHDDDSDAVVADGTGERSQRGVGGTLMGVGGQRRNHAPVGDVTQGVEHVEHDESDDEQHDEQRGVDIHQTEHAAEDDGEQHGRDSTADELPRTEASPLGGGVVDDVAQQRVDEDFCDTDNHHKAGDDADKLGRQRLIDAREQAAGHVHNEVRAHGVVESSLTQVTACVSDTLAELPLADSTVHSCCVAHFFLLL